MSDARGRVLTAPLRRSISPRRWSDSPGPGCAPGTATLSATGDDLGREAHASGQRADELNKRLLHIDTEVLPHAFGLGFELGQLSP